MPIAGSVPQALVGIHKLLVLQAVLLQRVQRGPQPGLHLQQLSAGHLVLLLQELQEDEVGGQPWTRAPIGTVLPTPQGAVSY